ncbi:MAG: hypothetical protein ABII72_03600 [Parcubacteria group bacterium]
MAGESEIRFWEELSQSGGTLQHGSSSRKKGGMDYKLTNSRSDQRDHSIKRDEEKDRNEKRSLRGLKGDEVDFEAPEWQEFSQQLPEKRQALSRRLLEKGYFDSLSGKPKTSLEVTKLRIAQEAQETVPELHGLLVARGVELYAAPFLEGEMTVDDVAPDIDAWPEGKRDRGRYETRRSSLTNETFLNYQNSEGKSLRDVLEEYFGEIYAFMQESQMRGEIDVDQDAVMKGYFKELLGHGTGYTSSLDIELDDFDGETNSSYIGSFDRAQRYLADALSKLVYEQSSLRRNLMREDIDRIAFGLRSLENKLGEVISKLYKFDKPESEKQPGAWAA